MMTKQRAIAARLLLLIGGLSGCGGGGDSSGSGSQVGSNSTRSLDAFSAQVLAMTASKTDDSEPKSIDGMVATKPENTEPGDV